MSKSLYIVDAFTSTPFGGNPAAVCLVEPEFESATMQQIAGELNLSETAFLSLIEPGLWSLRWFTPTVEIDLCGHATLASAHVLWNELNDMSTEIAFRTRSGDLSAARENDAIRLDFPSISSSPTENLAVFQEAIGTQPELALRSAGDLILVLADAQAVIDLTPDLEKIRALPARGLAVTAPGKQPEWDFVSRFFAPSLGIPEDPVTGAAHCFLGPYWAEILGKTRLTGYQASARGGLVGVSLAGDRVNLSGKAVTVVKGELII